MNFLLLNVLLALFWGALTGQLTPPNLAGGFVLGYALLWMSRRALGCTSYVTKVPKVVSFFGYFLVQLFTANLRVAIEVLTPQQRMRPAIVAIPLDVRRDFEITLLANLITLTPGTLSLDVSSDKRVLYVHSMYVDDIDAFRREIKNGFERRVKELFL
ncbi:MAG: Na+/H+ antiporter subunit E [Anaerolineaceae bacterium]|nr:Na+/H+ antiporter subunit E [Anaerolineaceae bacterium]